MWTPRLLCMPEHLMQINTPRLEDLMLNKFITSKQVRVISAINFKI